MKKRHAPLLVGMVGAHDDPNVDVELSKWVTAITLSLALDGYGVGAIPDCLVAPPERGGVHVEIYWIESED